jgi:uncharacterized protein
MKLSITIGQLLFFLILGLNYTTFGQKENPNYDSTIAKQFNGDAYGMKTYVFVQLKTGLNQRNEKSYVDSCFTSHMANIQKLVKEKKLIVAGPFMSNSYDMRGIFILDVQTIAEAEKLLLGDAAIQEGLLKAEYILWYGSAALPAYLPISEKINKTSF